MIKSNTFKVGIFALILASCSAGLFAVHVYSDEYDDEIIPSPIGSPLRDTREDESVCKTFTVKVHYCMQSTYPAYEGKEKIEVSGLIYYNDDSSSQLLKAFKIHLPNQNNVRAFISLKKLLQKKLGMNSENYVPHLMGEIRYLNGDLIFPKYTEFKYAIEILEMKPN